MSDLHTLPSGVTLDLSATHVDIGGGLAPAGGYTNLDHVHGEGVWRRSILDGIPVADGQLDSVRASHVMEHLPAGEPRLYVMNEVWRSLADHGTFLIIVPLAGSWQAYADPTHVSLWVPESFDYFDGTMAPQASYGLRPWVTLDFTVNHGWEGHWLGRPAR